MEQNEKSGLNNSTLSQSLLLENDSLTLESFSFSQNPPAATSPAMSGSLRELRDCNNNAELDNVRNYTDYTDLDIFAPGYNYVQQDSGSNPNLEIHTGNAHNVMLPKCWLVW